MEWTKIKPKHFLYSDYTLGNIGCLTVLLCLTAHYERLPTRSEMVHHTHIRALESLEKALIGKGYTVDDVLMKVLEDADRVEHKRAVSRKTSKTYREKQNLGDTSLDTTDKIREDKSRVDNAKEDTPTYKPFLKPSLEELKKYINEKGASIDPQRFLDFYESKGWMIGKNKMKDWKAAVRTWINTDKAIQPHEPKRKYLN